MSNSQCNKRGRPSSEGTESDEVCEQLPVRYALVVDGRAGIRFLLSWLLSRAEHMLDVADGGARAWRMMAQKRFDALISDLRMSCSDRKELYQWLNEVDSLLTWRVILVMGDTVDPETRDIGAATGSSIVGESFDLAELQAQLRALFDDEGPKRALG